MDKYCRTNPFHISVTTALILKIKSLHRHRYTCDCRSQGQKKEKIELDSSIKVNEAVLIPTYSTFSGIKECSDGEDEKLIRHRSDISRCCWLNTSRSTGFDMVRTQDEDEA